MWKYEEEKTRNFGFYWINSSVFENVWCNTIIEEFYDYLAFSTTF